MKTFNIVIKLLQTLIMFSILVFLVSNNYHDIPNKVYENKLPPPRTVTLNTNNNPIIGDSNAKVELVVFSDFECPFCFDMYNQIKGITKEYIESGKVKYTFINYPLVKHKKATFLAKISEYAFEKNKFEETYSVLFEKHSEINEYNYLDYLNNIFPDSLDFKAYMNIPNLALSEDLKKVQRLGIKGTPVFIVNNQLYLGIRSNKEFKEIIDNAIMETDNMCD